MCCNVLGNNIIPPVIITRSKNPRYLKGINKEEYCHHFSNPKAWMTRFIFQEILSKINNNNTSGHIVLLLDNFSGHKVSNPEKYENITLIFLPQYSTSLHQPLDKDIIKSFKTFYRS